jgi:hypothetical protein
VLWDTDTLQRAGMRGVHNLGVIICVVKVDVCKEIYINERITVKWGGKAIKKLRGPGKRERGPERGRIKRGPGRA